MFADLAGLPDLLVQVAADEVLLDDAHRLAEAGAALGRLGEFLRTRLSFAVS